MDAPIRNEDAHEAIVSRKLFSAVQGARQLSKRPNGGQEGKWTQTGLLPGLVYCTGCGKRCQVRVSDPAGGKKTRRAYYGCQTHDCQNRARVNQAELPRAVFTVSPFPQGSAPRCPFGQRPSPCWSWWWAGAVPLVPARGFSPLRRLGARVGGRSACAIRVECLMPYSKEVL
jgi:hypothetical protein